MEGLSRMLDKAKQMQWISGFDVGRRNLINISHFLYADDTLIFCGVDRNQVLYLNQTLLIFEALSCFHINMLKSVIYPVNEVHNMEELAGILGCSIGTFPTTYKGLPLGGKFKLEASPLTISLYLMSSRVLKQLDKIRRKFMWEGNDKDHKFHLVKWSKVELSKHQGGLGIKNLALHNICLLMKWLRSSVLESEKRKKAMRPHFT
ncbi:uncharacterized protein [Nicotiana sylvestris]|uniref:uncharacterized protein n=1 Tax=Nicotiana sylvestris TaxID=4096 RepID=UPI00388C9239